jgi:hypothetical protein
VILRFFFQYSMCFGDNCMRPSPFCSGLQQGDAGVGNLQRAYDERKLE